MLRYAVLASALALSVPAVAQESTTPPADDAAQTATPQESAPAQSSAPSTAQAAPSKAQSVAEIVKAEFPAYDKDKSGELSKAEFQTWLVALKTKSDPSAASNQAALDAWAGKAFAQADKDKSGNVSEPEVTSFFSGAA